MHTPVTATGLEWALRKLRRDAMCGNWPSMAARGVIAAVVWLAVAVHPTGGQSYVDISSCQGPCLPIIFAHPHDGTEVPAGWPARTDGCMLPGAADCSWGDACDGQSLDPASCAARTNRDSFTRLVGAFAEERLWELTGARPMVVSNLLARSVLDANRALPEAAQDWPPAVQAWYNYTAAVDAAVANATAGPCRSALFLDMHGQAHSHGLLELGYALSSSRLAASDEDMAAAPGTYQDRSTVRVAVSRLGPLPFSTLLRDSPPHPNTSAWVSMGGMMQARGVGTIPSPAHPDASGGLQYFSGGYSTRRWSSLDADPPSTYPVDAVQVEIPNPVRWGNTTVRRHFGRALGEVVLEWMQRFHGVQLAGSAACWAPPPAPAASATSTPASTPQPSTAPSAAASASASVAPGGQGAGGGGAASSGGGGSPAFPPEAGWAIGAVGMVAVVALAAWAVLRCRRKGRQPATNDPSSAPPADDVQLVQVQRNPVSRGSP